MDGSPQKENGYVAIANEIVEHLSYAGLNGSEYRLILVVLRKTYGFNKKIDRISLSQFEEFTQMKRSHVVKTIHSLVHKRVLLKEKGLYSFNKHWKEWGVHKRIPSIQTYTPASPQMGTKSSPQKGTHKRQKDNLQKTSARTPEKEEKKKDPKFPFGEFKNVLLTIDEKEKLKELYGVTVAKKYVEDLSIGIESKGYKYKSHYATIRGWARRDGVQPIVKPKVKEPEPEQTEEEKKRNAELRSKISEQIKNRFKK